LKGRVDRHDQRLDYLHDNIVDNSTRITVVEDGVKANAKDINVVGNIALENRQFIGNNKAAIDKNTKAIDALKGQVGTTIKNIETTINNKITENNVTINK
ncbi:KID repeat protein, partial [human gut metagenome]